MAVQAPLFSENLDFPVNDASPGWWAANSGFGLPDPFTNLAQPLQVNGPVNSAVLCRDGRVAAPSSSSSPSCAMNFQPFRVSNALSDEFERQRREIDIFLQLQNETLKHTIQEQKQQQVSALLNSLEPTMLAMIRKTDQDLAAVTSKTRELEDCLKRAEMETKAWQKVAKENEAMVVGLNSMLDQIKERLCWATGSGGRPAQDAESVCECGGGGGGDGELNRFRGEIGITKMCCKWCKSQRCCIVFLPCKHLCACRQCGSLLEMCPVCESVKEGSIEVFLN